ncbi:MAG: class IV lanthionine synthetase LanL [Thermoleophilia bacterium]|nr:class IV lanthionine synthetase LanL [Thermoleophilia bacterium]
MGREQRPHAERELPPGGERQPERASYRTLVEELRDTLGIAAAVSADADPLLGPLWVSVAPEGVEPPEQGWKLHVSATAWSAEDVLRRVVPVLLRERVPFKVAASADVLEALNSGIAGLDQVGKFVAVYPATDEQAVRLAVGLDEATRGLGGPAVPGERSLGPDSLVHYRYGAFAGRMVQSPWGEITPVIRAPDGTLVPDRRHGGSPDWAVDPFVEAGVAEQLDDRLMQVVGKRFLLLAPLHRSPRGMVYAGSDLESLTQCIVKRAPRRALVAEGSDARDFLRHEADVLRRLADARFPEFLGVVEHDGDLYLGMELVEGEPLAYRVGKALREGRVVAPAQAVAWGRELAATLGTIHARGLVYRDLKPLNVIVAPDGHLRMIDFDFAWEAGRANAPGMGSRGYCSPQQARAEPPSVTDDVYALGALLYSVVTGAEPSLAPDPFDLLARPVELLNPSVGTPLARVIACCLDPDPARRYQSMAQVDDALAAIGDAAEAAPHAFGSGAALADDDRRRYAELARGLADTLAVDAGQLARAHELAGADAPLVYRDVGIGTAGLVLALSEVVDVFGDTRHREALEVVARALVHALPPDGEPVSGLYVGEAGIVAALLRAGQVLGDAALVSEAAGRGRKAAQLRDASSDLFNGTAGRLRVHLWLFDTTGDEAHLADALAAGERLLARAEPAGGDGLSWSSTLPDGEVVAYLGYAHGAAGIGDALLDLFEVTGETRFRDAARAASRWIAPLGAPTLADGTGLDWPDVEAGELGGPLWCHGAAGIGRFFLHAARHALLEDAEQLARRAARTAARGGRHIGPTQCHGLAGSIEFLLDVAHATGDARFLHEARELAMLLEAFVLDRGGRVVVPGDAPTIVRPAYTTGYAGTAVCLLRLADPERRPHQLSAAGFRFRELEREPLMR